MSSKPKVIKPDVPEINLICCGGGGTNIGIGFATTPMGDGSPRTAAINVAVIDFSDGNLRHVRDTGITSTIVIDRPDGQTGQGKKRGNADLVRGIIDRHLDEVPPSQHLNILLTTMSGGSGSTIAPILLEEYVRNGHPVAVVAIASDEDALAASNSMECYYDMLTALEAGQQDVPITVVFNAKGKRYTDADSNASEAVAIYAAVAASAAVGQDISDLRNWLSSTKTYIENAGSGTHVPTLLGMDWAEGLSSIPDHVNGLYSILATDESDRYQGMADVSYTALRDVAAVQKVEVDLHLWLTTDMAAEYAEKLGAAHAAYSARTETKRVVAPRTRAPGRRVL
jgi:hypothetical protein